MPMFNQNRFTDRMDAGAKARQARTGTRPQARRRDESHRRRTHGRTHEDRRRTRSAPRREGAAQAPKPSASKPRSAPKPSARKPRNGPRRTLEAERLAAEEAQAPRRRRIRSRQEMAGRGREEEDRQAAGRPESHARRPIRGAQAAAEIEPICLSSPPPTRGGRSPKLRSSEGGRVGGMSSATVRGCAFPISTFVIPHTNVIGAGRQAFHDRCR